LGDQLKSTAKHSSSQKREKHQRLKEMCVETQWGFFFPQQQDEWCQLMPWPLVHTTTAVCHPNLQALQIGGCVTEPADHGLSTHFGQHPNPLTLAFAKNLQNQKRKKESFQKSTLFLF